MNDLRYAIRSLRNSPTFSLVAIVTLALGIGVSTAGFSLADWLLLRPVPGVTRPDRVAVVWNAYRARFGMMPKTFSYQQYDAIRSELTALSGFAGYQGLGHVSLGAQNAEPRRLDAELVMPSFFWVLGVRPSLGRTFVPDDDAEPAGQDVAIISDRLWAGMLGRDPAVLGHTLTIDGRPFTVVGVAAPGFHGTDRLGQVDVWLPGRTQQSTRLGYSQFVARLAPGATFARAEAQLRGAMRSVQDTTRGPVGGVLGPFVFRGLGLVAPSRSSVTGVMRLALAVCLAVLLVTCANTANLMLFRGLMRRGTVALHRVLGAGATDVTRGALAESLALALPAIALGLVLAQWFVHAFQGVRLWPGIVTPASAGLSWPVIAFACATGLLSVLLAGAASAYVAVRTEAREAISGTSRSVATGGLRARRAFGATQLALSLALLVGALLMVRSLRQMNAVDLGFNPHDVVILQANPRESGETGPAVDAFYRQLLARVQAVPALGPAALASHLPFEGWLTIYGMHLPGAAPQSEGVHVRYDAISPRYFDVMGIPLLAGRSLTDAETFQRDSAAGRVVLSAAAARRMFGDRSAIGRTLVIDQIGDVEVVGVAADSKWESFADTSRQGPMSADPGVMVYGPFERQWFPPGQRFLWGTALVVRSNLPTATVAAAVRRLAREVDPTVPIFGATTLQSLIDQYLAGRLLFRKLLSALGVLTVVLEAVGLYGLIAFGVSARTRELGIRIALGAKRRDIVETALHEGLIVVAIGLVAGLVGGWGVGLLVRSKLYGVAPLDLASYGFAASVLAIASLAAAIVPARAATCVDPLEALRYE